MINKLFVYGSLMESVETSISKLLKANAHFIGETTCQGQLYNLGRYPGLVLSENPDHQVKGHLFELIDPNYILPILDEYEGNASNDPDRNEYLRIEIEVKYGAITHKAWVYLYNLSTEGLALIQEGDYLKHLEADENFRRFLDSV